MILSNSIGNEVFDVTRSSDTRNRDAGRRLADDRRRTAEERAGAEEAQARVPVLRAADPNSRLQRLREMTQRV
jgi:hypothetical protein